MLRKHVGGNNNRLVKTSQVFLPVVLLVFLFSGVALPQNWPVFQGSAEHTGLATAIAVPLSKAWSKSARGYWGFRSAPVVYGKIVYVGSMDRYVYARRCDNGKIEWEFKTDGRINFPSPAVDANNIYIGNDKGSFYCLDRSNGNIKWRFICGNRIESSAVVGDGIVYFGCKDKHLYALSVSDGSLRWKFAADGPVFSSPCLARGNVYFGAEGFTGRKFYALNAKTGKAVFTFKTGGAIYSTPAYKDGVVYFGSMDGNLYALNASSGKVVWRYKTGKGIASSPAVANGMVFVGSQDKHYHAVDAKTGRGRWKFALAVNQEFMVGFTLKEGTKSYYPGFSSPVVSGDVVFVQFAYWLTGLDAATGESIWSHQFSKPRAKPADGPAVAIANGMLFTCDRQYVHAFVPNRKNPQSAK